MNVFKHVASLKQAVVRCLAFVIHFSKGIDVIQSKVNQPIFKNITLVKIEDFSHNIINTLFI